MASQHPSAITLFSEIQKEQQSDLRLGKLFSDLIHVMDIAVWELDLDYRVIAGNQKAKTIYGEGIAGRFCYEIVDRRNTVCPRCPVQKVYQGAKSGRSEHQRIDASGNIIFIDHIATPIQDKNGNLVGVLALIIDITARRQMEEELKSHRDRLQHLVDQQTRALKQSEQYFRTILKSIHEDILVISADYKIEDINNAFLKLTGHKRDEIIGRSCYEVSHGFNQPCDNFGIKCGLRKVFQTGQPCNCIHEHKHTDGSAIWVDIALAPIKDKEGRVTQVIESVRDISNIIKIEEQQKRLNAAIDQVGDMVVITDRQGNIEYINPAFEKTTQYTRAEVMGKNIRLLTSGQQDETFFRNLWETITDGRNWSGQMINKRKDGTLFTEESTISPVFDNNGNIVNFVSVKRDITHEIKMMERLRQAQRLEALGTLAGGIAHDFNNILFPIVGLAELLLEDLAPQSLDHENAREILRASKRGSDLVKQILAFSRQYEHKMTPVRIQPILKEVLKLGRSTIPANIEIVQDIQSDCGLIMADPIQLHQVAMNLITNAYHAVENTDGKISVQLKTTKLEADDLAGSSLEPGQYAVLCVADTGTGIEPAVMDKIFEPYFTTKTQGKGTGLGLAVVYGIVKEHDGDIRVYSRIGKGTTFNVYLPLTPKTSATVSIDEIVSDKTGRERILLVDDEAPIARLEKQMLERLGYRVTSRVDSMDALEVFKARPDAFDLVITDMTMPNMTGDQFARQLLAIKPDLPVIICTGFSEKIDQDKITGMGLKGLLMKPIVKAEMARMVRKVLDAAKDATQE